MWKREELKLEMTKEAGDDERSLLALHCICKLRLQPVSLERSSFLDFTTMTEKGDKQH